MSDPSTTTTHEVFLQQVIASQGMLRAVILSLVGDEALVDEILQETNLAMIRSEDNFTLGTKFHSWATSLACYQVLANRKRQQRSKLVFKDEIVQLLAAETESQAERHDARRDALRDCLTRLSDPQRRLLEQRYSGQSVQRMARESGTGERVISQTLYRLRRTLKECIERRRRGTAP